MLHWPTMLREPVWEICVMKGCILQSERLLTCLLSPLTLPLATPLAQLPLTHPSLQRWNKWNMVCIVDQLGIMLCLAIINYVAAMPDSCLVHKLSCMTLPAVCISPPGKSPGRTPIYAALVCSLSFKLAVVSPSSLTYCALSQITVTLYLSS